MKRIKLERVIIITIAMTIIGGLQSWYDHVTIGSMFSLGESDMYKFQTALLFNLISGASGGFFAAITLNFIDDRYRTKPYYQGLIIIVSMFMLVWATRNAIEAVILMENEPTKGFVFAFDAIDMRNIIFWMTIVLLSYFFLQMENKFGPGKLTQIFFGKYNIPREEERVFMFLDLKSSTTIAENLGGIKYHLFLKELFSDITTPILETGGEIYQYVGDEVVLSWPTEGSGNLNYIRCFFAIQQLLKSEENKYLQRFGVKPYFKAGAHHGTVIAGEIGVVKRDITYSGDVLNTTARIQSMCNELHSSFLISNDLLDLHPIPYSDWIIERKGEIQLKGKSETIELMSIYKY
jgi:adenylate cyclase